MSILIDVINGTIAIEDTNLASLTRLNYLIRSEIYPDLLVKDTDDKKLFQQIQIFIKLEESTKSILEQLIKIKKNLNIKENIIELLNSISKVKNYKKSRNKRNYLIAHIKKIKGITILPSDKAINE